MTLPLRTANAMAVSQSVLLTATPVAAAAPGRLRVAGSNAAQSATVPET